MSGTILLTSLGTWFFGALFSVMVLCFKGRGVRGGGGLAMLGALMACGAAVSKLVSGVSPMVILQKEWAVPGGMLSLGLDNLSAFFLLLIAWAGGWSALYALGYLSADVRPRESGIFWFFSTFFWPALSWWLRPVTGCCFLSPGKECRLLPFSC